jgi:group I intron endonuclease
MKIVSGIYKITNPNGEVYIGQSIDIYHRWNRYKKHIDCIKSQTKVYNSIKKYGIENHNFDIIESCGLDILNERERYYQDHYDSVNFGLNCKYTTTESKSGNLSNETKTKISKALNNRIFTKEWKEKLSKSKIGKKLSKESIKKRTESRKGYSHTDVTINKMKESHKQFKPITCPHCGKTGKQGLYRWHFNNCKLRLF